MAGLCQELSPQQSGELLADAVDRNFPVSVGIDDRSTWVQHKSRFLGRIEGRQPRLWLEAVINPTTREPITLAAGQMLLVNFNIGQDRYRLSVPVVACESYRLAGGEQVPGLAVAWPAALQKIHRREHFRYEPLLSQRIEVILWDGGLDLREQVEQGARPTYRGRVVNISVGGMRTKFPAKPDPRLRVADKVGIRFQPEFCQKPVEVEAMIRYAGKAGDSAIEFGLQFIGLGATAEGRKLLTDLSRMLADLQRTGIRRRRIGLD